MHSQALLTSHYPWYIRLIFWVQKRKYGQVLNSALVWGKSPMIFLALSWFYRCIDRKNSPLSPTLKTLIIVRVSQLNECSFCIDLNTSILIQRGFDLKKIQSLSFWQKSEVFDDLEKLVLEYTEAVTESKNKIDEQLRIRMSQHFNETEIVEITAIIAFQNMSTKFNNAFDIKPQGFCPPNLETISLKKE